jgi:hypothetical protein
VRNLYWTTVLFELTGWTLESAIDTETKSATESSSASPSSKCKTYSSENAILCRVATGGSPALLFPRVPSSSFVAAAWMGCVPSPQHHLSPQNHVFPLASTVYPIGMDCLLRGPSEHLREPERTHAAYEPAQPLSVRLQYFDNIPWQLWDLREEGGGALYQQEQHQPPRFPTFLFLSREEIVRQIETLMPLREEVVHGVPLLLPSLGLLHPLGQRLVQR